MEKRNSPFTPTACDLLFYQIPTYYCWNAITRKWERRKRNQRYTSFGRMHLLSPGLGDIFYLRLLLANVKGATSFRNLRVHKGIVYGTFRAAADARGLLHDDRNYIVTLQEGHDMRPGRSLRKLFVGLLIHCEVSNPLLL